MEKITLTIDAQTFNVLMAGLEELPHKISRKIIDDLINQVKPQINDTPQGPLSDKVFN
jgi:hypothetical protein